MVIVATIIRLHVYGPAITEARLKNLNAVSCGYQKDWDIKQTVEHTWTTGNLISKGLRCSIWCSASHTMDLLWEKFQWILPFYMKPISFQRLQLFVQSLQPYLLILPEETTCVFPTYWSKNKWISEFHRTNPQELKCWSTFCVNHFLIYYLMMQHQHTVKRVNGTHEWAHRPYISY